MSNSFSVPTPANFSFFHAVAAHGWYDLVPFDFEPGKSRLNYVYRSPTTSTAEWIELTDRAGKLTIRTSRTAKKAEAVRIARHILRLDEEFDEFYDTIRCDPEFGWVENKRAGRLLRSSTVFEDAIKTMCTTNCTWALTKIMTGNLVEAFGESAANGRKGFPSAESLAGATEAFFRENIRTGYRSPYIIEFSERVATGEIDPESWLTSDLPTDDLRKKILGVKGIGPYAAENLLKLLGRYEGMALDSWLRAGFYRKHNKEKQCPDKRIEKHYRRFGKWKGLAIWCDMTKSWFDGDE